MPLFDSSVKRLRAAIDHAVTNFYIFTADSIHPPMWAKFEHDIAAAAAIARQKGNSAKVDELVRANWNEVHGVHRDRWQALLTRI